MFMRCCGLLILFILLISSCAGEITKNPIDDDTPPQLQAHLPVANALDQPRNVRIELYFDDIMLLNSCNDKNFYLTKEGSTVKIPVKEYTSSEVNGKRSLFLYFSSNLAPNTTYRVHVGNGPNNQGGQPYAGSSWKFTTGTTTTNYKPELTITTPTNMQFFGKQFQAKGGWLGAQLLYYSINSVKEVDWRHLPVVGGGEWSTPFTNVKNNPYFAFVEGENTFYIHGRKYIGGVMVTTTRSMKFMVDTKPPVVSISSPTHLDQIKSSVSVIGSASDQYLESVEWCMGNDGGFALTAWVPVVGMESWSFLLDTLPFADCDVGNHTYSIKVRAKDKAGNCVTNYVVVDVQNWDMQTSYWGVASGAEYGFVFGLNTLIIGEASGLGHYAFGYDSGAQIGPAGNYSSAINYVVREADKWFAVSSAQGRLRCGDMSSGQWVGLGDVSSTLEYGACVANDVAYIAYASTLTNLILVDTIAGGWNVWPLRTYSEGKICAISSVIDSSGVAWVSYLYQAPSVLAKIYVLKVSFSPFSVVEYYLGETDTKPDNDYLYNFTKLVIQDDGNPLVFFSTGTRDGLYYSKFNGSSWTQGIEPFGLHILGLDAVNVNGVLHLSYIDNSGSLIYARKTASGWVRSGAISPASGTKTRIYVDGNVVKIAATSAAGKPIICTAALE